MPIQRTDVLVFIPFGFDLRCWELI